MQSGVAINPWASIKNPKTYGIRLAENLGFKSEDPKEIVKFLKTVEPIMLTKAQEQVITTEVSSVEFSYYNFIIN